MEKKYSALDIAKWFLWKNKVEQIENEDESDDKYEVYEGLSHLKLQKLLYFAQGVNLVVNDKALFSDRIVAWTHGPVVRKIYDTYKKFGRDDISIELTEQDNKIIENIELDSDTSYVLNLVYNNFCIYTAWQLREMTHIPKGPWETTVREKGMDKEIDLSIIKDYFDKNIVTNE
ncbi:MAG: SocA family protein [Bacilli bacterium]|nr:SocA family protein [Bacilli bacterium]